MGSLQRPETLLQLRSLQQQPSCTTGALSSAAIGPVLTTHPLPDPSSICPSDGISTPLYACPSDAISAPQTLNPRVGGVLPQQRCHVQGLRRAGCAWCHRVVLRGGHPVGVRLRSAPPAGRARRLIFCCSRVLLSSPHCPPATLLLGARLGALHAPQALASLSVRVPRRLPYVCMRLSYMCEQGRFTTRRAC